MGFDLHTVEVLNGSTTSQEDRVITGVLPGLTNAAGGSAGAAVTTAVTLPAGTFLPPTYGVQVTASQACFVSVTGKTQSGFNVVLTPVTSEATLAAGTFDVLITA
jgi:hypothetical protein